MVKILKPILLVFIKSKAMKRLIVDLLKAIAKQTDNTIDDQAVAFIEARMFPGSTTNLFNDMKVTKFLNIDIEPAPPELELEIEMQCREIMKSNNLDSVKRYCTHMVRKKFDQDIFMASLLNRLIELEANRVVKEMRKEKPKNPFKKFFRIR